MSQSTKNGKTVSILIPCYNEEENVGPMSAAIDRIFREELPQYEYELVFIDNDSTDHTRPLLRGICANNPRVKAIFNAKNFGQFSSPYYGICQTSGDCTICLACDFQTPPELIPELVAKWEEGYRIVCAVKTQSEEGRVIRFLRSCYYKLIKKMSNVDQIEHFTGDGLYDRSFVQVLRDLHDPTPFLRGIVAELGYRRTQVEYDQQKRRAGKTHNNWGTLYDGMMLSFTSYTKTGLRFAGMAGSVLSVISLIVALVYLILKLLFWNRFPAGMIPVLLAVCVFSSVQIFLIGLLGEHILSINKRVMNRPLVIEEERINFTRDDRDKGRSGGEEANGAYSEAQIK
ncbi:MAG: glycosyltransferase family 2 protein [Eubacteriales bacterium]|nr:glycosyltransferase family 2 protein [Eubacteriales bacterium]